MRATGWIIMTVVALVILLVVGIVAGRVGGIAIRKQGVTEPQLQVQVSQPIVRGVPVAVHWDPALAGLPAALSFDWRDTTEEYQLGAAPTAAGQATLQFPCAASASEGGLIIRAAADGKVIGNQLLELAPAGPECVQ